MKHEEKPVCILKANLTFEMLLQNCSALHIHNGRLGKRGKLGTSNDLSILKYIGDLGNA